MATSYPPRPTRVHAVFGGKSMSAPHSIDGHRVLAAFPREDELGYIVVFNIDSTPEDKYGDVDGYVVAEWSGARLYAIAHDLAYLPAIERASLAAYQNEGATV